MAGGMEGGKGGGARGPTFLPSTRDENQIFVSDFFLKLFEDIFTKLHIYDYTAVVPELLDLVRNIFNSEGTVKRAHFLIFLTKMKSS